jgi:hypothetical protein
VTQDWSLGPYFGGGRINFPVLRRALEVAPQGYALEFGVAEGTSLAIIADKMPVVGFDSFLGLPEEWGPYPVGARACQPPNIPNTRLVVGLYADTLPGFDFGEVDPISLVHFDCDLYSSCVTVLDWVGPWLGAGTLICFDEWHGNPWHADHEEKAWHEFASDTGIKWEVIGHDSEAWAIKIVED